MAEFGTGLRARLFPAEQPASIRLEPRRRSVPPVERDATAPAVAAAAPRGRPATPALRPASKRAQGYARVQPAGWPSPVSVPK